MPRAISVLKRAYFFYKKNINRGFLLLEILLLLSVLSVILPLIYDGAFSIQRYVTHAKYQVHMALELDYLDRFIREDFAQCVSIDTLDTQPLTWRHAHGRTITYRAKHQRFYRHDGSRGRYLTERLKVHSMTANTTSHLDLTLVVGPQRHAHHIRIALPN